MVDKMKDKIPQFLQNKMLQKKVFTQKFPNEIKQFMLDYSIHYGWGLTDITLIFRAMKKGYSTLPKCGYNGCENQNRIIQNTVSIDDGCSKLHATKNRSLLKYGVESANQVLEKKEKTKLNLKDKYGVDNVFKLSTIKEKIKQTNIDRYGVEYIMQSTKIKSKMQVRCLEKYGVEHVNMLDSKKDKIKQTMISKYGVENPQQVKTVKEKTMDTCLRRYGVENPQQNPTIHMKNVKSSYNKKDYIWKTGEESRLQGYEPFVLKELEEQGYSYNDILTSTSDMPEIWYDFEGKKHRYYPDFYIPSENLIIEVKSCYTLELHWERNQAKFQAVKQLGFNFRLEIR